jgi:hypothetical protein
MWVRLRSISAGGLRSRVGSVVGQGSGAEAEGTAVSGDPVTPGAGALSGVWVAVAVQVAGRGVGVAVFSGVADGVTVGVLVGTEVGVVVGSGVNVAGCGQAVAEGRGVEDDRGGGVFVGVNPTAWIATGVVSGVSGDGRSCAAQKNHPNAASMPKTAVP